jgi:hypothetical protein
VVELLRADPHRVEEKEFHVAAVRSSLFSGRV